jgi:hypothetical protein
MSVAETEKVSGASCSQYSGDDYNIVSCPKAVPLDDMVPFDHDDTILPALEVAHVLHLIVPLWATHVRAGAESGALHTPPNGGSSPAHVGNPVGSTRNDSSHSGCVCRGTFALST